MIKGGGKKLDLETALITTGNKAHLLKSQIFYYKRKTDKKQSRKCTTKEAICFDFGNNFSYPNISTNDVHYKDSCLCMYLTFIFYQVEKASFIYIQKLLAKKEVMKCVLLYTFCVQK
jgi:hypothetical protein